MLLVLAALYAAATVLLAVFGLNYLVLTACAAGQGKGGRVGPSNPPPEEEWPRVTVQLPLYNERAVAARLLDACAALDYPRDRLDLQVLDDSTDETAAVVAERAAHWRREGVRVAHIRRPGRAGYKAGALAHGLDRGTGELVAVFDADFVPPRDFLRRTVPPFADPGIAVVQARWAHLNANASALTAAQAALLDAHFCVEQRGRACAGWPLAFNGTAGVWRRAAIEDAGGWSADTLTEDLDLSYRAQLRGWRIRYDSTLAVPAELPATHAAWRQQQFRWTKGAAEVARKLLRPLWRSGLPLAAKVQGTFHLTSFVVYPAALLLALLHAPLLWAHVLTGALPEAAVRALGLGLLGLVGVAVAHTCAQRALYPDWSRRMLAFPWWLAAAVGLAASNTQAVWEGLRGRRSPFVRTPKGGGYAVPGGGVRRAEAALALYAVLGLVALAATGVWSAIPFQTLFAVGFGTAALAEWMGQPPSADAARASRRTFRPERAAPAGAR